MKNIKITILATVYVLALGLITGCTITTTRNIYYGCPDPSKKSNKNDIGAKQAADSLRNNKNGQH